MAINFDHTGAGSLTLKSPASGSTTLTLPTADGTSGQVLQTNGSGELSFVGTISPSGGITAIAVVTALPGSPNANTLYIVTG